MQEVLQHGQHTVILDGLPRTYAQAEQLDSILDVVQIFHLRIEDTKLAMERLKVRALHDNRLDDMNEEVIRRRLNTYYEETYKTLSFYPPEIIYEVDAGQCMIDVLRDIVNRFSEVKDRLARDSPLAAAAPGSTL
jgi:adenylate kinase